MIFTIINYLILVLIILIRHGHIEKNDDCCIRGRDGIGIVEQLPAL